MNNIHKNKNDYERVYVNVPLLKNESMTRNAPDFIFRNVQLSENIMNYIADRIRNNMPVSIDVAMFQRDKDFVVTLSVPYFPKRKSTNLEEFLK
jgi:hypothetical protein